VVWCDLTLIDPFASPPFARLFGNHAAAPLWGCGEWNGKRLLMTCINLSYPDDSSPDDPGGNRSSSIHPEYAVAAIRLVVALGDLGRTAPVPRG